MTEDLAVIFLNSVDPFDDDDTIPYKMLFGNKTPEIIDLQQTPGFMPNSKTESIGGFILTSEVETIVEWIKERKIDSLEGFTEIYDKLSDSVKTKLSEMGSPDKEVLFKFYVQPLTHFYFKAKEDQNSIVITGE